METRHEKLKYQINKIIFENEEMLKLLKCIVKAKGYRKLPIAVRLNVRHYLTRPMD